MYATDAFEMDIKDGTASVLLSYGNFFYFKFCIFIKIKVVVKKNVFDFAFHFQ